MPEKALKNLSLTQAATLIKLSKFPEHTAYITYELVRKELESKGYVKPATCNRSTLTEAGLAYVNNGIQVKYRQ